MDTLAALKAELEKKRKQTNSLSAERGPNKRPAKRWRSMADIEEERTAAYLERERNIAEKKRLECERKWKLNRVEPLKSEVKGPDATVATPSVEDTQETEQHTSRGASEGSEVGAANALAVPPLPKQEVIRRLRTLKEPATLFGENSWDRFNRMRERELAREENSKGQRNVFQKKLREMEAKDAEDDVYHYTGSNMPHLVSTTGSEKKRQETAVEPVEATACKEDYVHQQIQKYMMLWASEIDGMSKEERRTNKGRSLVVTHEQTKDWFRPLHKLLRRRKLPRNILDALRDIFEAAAKREYVRASSLYLERLAIGNAPWPMGATMVGIHARAAREKIGEDKIAHVMNDEKTRKYIQAVKRLLTVAQRHFPTSFSKMIM